jgi:hypothetical protein
MTSITNIDSTDIDSIARKAPQDLEVADGPTFIRKLNDTFSRALVQQVINQIGEQLSENYKDCAWRIREAEKGNAGISAEDQLYLILVCRIVANRQRYCNT